MRFLSGGEKIKVLSSEDLHQYDEGLSTGDLLKKGLHQHNEGLSTGGLLEKVLHHHDEEPESCPSHEG